MIVSVVTDRHPSLSPSLSLPLSLQDDYGWKIISTDVFRFPPHKSLLAAILGQWIYHVLLDSVTPSLPPSPLPPSR